MAQWRPIVTALMDNPIWVLKYDMYSKGSVWCDADTPEAIKHTSCYGYYTTEADAIRVRQHFPNPQMYQIEKVWHREIIG